MDDDTNMDDDNYLHHLQNLSENLNTFNKIINIWNELIYNCKKCLKIVIAMVTHSYGKLSE